MRNFWNSLQFRIPIVFIISFLFVLAAIFGVFSTLGKANLTNYAYKEVVLSGKNIVSELGNRIALVESLAIALAKLGEQLSADEALNKRLIEHVMNYEGTETFIAGGGIWPEPYQFDPAIERRSFFWGRDKSGQLQYYDDYNNPKGPGYHHEEWYVPARHLSGGRAFWSKSYMDPYSYQPMVTVTVPMYRDGRFYGVSTVDLKLEGLHALLEEVTRAYGGYAFAVDRNGKFLSFPNERLTKIYGIDAQGMRTEEFIHAKELALKQPVFQPLATALQDTIQQTIQTAQKNGVFENDLAEAIANDSYQIDAHEARLIAAILSLMQQPAGRETKAPVQLFLEDDTILGEPAFAAVFEMPDTYWKIVTVMPYSMATMASKQVYRNLVSTTLLVMILSLIVILILIRKTLTSPIADMSKQLQVLAETTDTEHQQLETTDKGELGQLAYWFNRRSDKLIEVQNQLSAARSGLEQRVKERTRELQEEIEKREKEQRIKEVRVARVEKQYSAIIDLSMNESLYTEDIVAAARLINKTAAKAIDVGRSSLWLIKPDKDTLELVDLYNSEADTHESGIALPLGEYPAYIHALDTERSTAIVDIYSDPRSQEFNDYARTYGITSMLDSPLRAGGKLIGVTCFEHTGPKREWHEDEIRFSGEVANQFLQVLANAERIKSENKIRQLAFYDPLTNLSNRRLLLETIHHELTIAQRRGTYGSLIYLDLDNFKTLNDALGHAVGDELLVQLSERFSATLRKEDMAARLGGDEFVVLISGESSTRQLAMEQALRVARKLQETIRAPYRLHGYDHIITSSMGITVYPETSGTADDVLQQADTAMYRAKADGRNNICFYNEEMQRRVDIRLQIEKELRAAIQEKEFEIYFQPQVNARGQHVGAEALVRWNHPVRGMISPAEFIPIAEETGLILELGAWILKDACRFARECSLKHIAINISPAQFRQPDFLRSVNDILACTETGSSTLMFELTEGVVIENIDDTIDKMNALQDMGIRISIDDFGTGYSSLAYLKRLPLDQLKISNDFVRDILTDSNDAIIVDTILSMARHMGLTVVAEGIETLEQLKFLDERACPIFQGYYFNKPLSKEDFRAYLIENQILSQEQLDA